LQGRVAGNLRSRRFGFLFYLLLAATMNQKSSLREDPQFVSAMLQSGQAAAEHRIDRKLGGGA
jgi:hypothetical protein